MFIVQKENFIKLLMGITLVFLSIFSGILVLTSYTANLFKDSGSNFDADISAIIVGALQVCGTYVSSLLVDRVGRKLLFGCSSFGASISLVFFGTFSYLNKQGLDLSVVEWLPVASASLYIFANCVGMRCPNYLIFCFRNCFNEFFWQVNTFSVCFRNFA